MFISYDKNDFERLNKQHNIMVLVGNGFDIAALKHYGTGNMKGKTTSYTDFFEYITYFRLCDTKNCIYQKMLQDRNMGKENWSDFELSLNTLITEKSADLEMIEVALGEIQEGFSHFLNALLPADTIVKMNAEVQKKGLATQSLSSFLSDIQNQEDCGMRFPRNTECYDLYNFLFVNFNYTMLLDNYICLDKEQFDPHRHGTVDTHFSFRPDEHNLFQTQFGRTTDWSSYVILNVIHPHGYQDIPRSMIFGTELLQYDKTKKIKSFVKSFWARDDVKYGKYFVDTELFIIYGMSMTKTDSWWLDRVYERLESGEAELIIYFYGKAVNREAVKDNFLSACQRNAGKADEEVRKNIYVVTLTDNNNYFLGFEKKTREDS